MKIIFIADFFIDEVPGGGELNNEELINLFNSTKNYYNDIGKIKSSDVSLGFLKDNSDSSFIVLNFINLHPDCRDFLKENCH